MRVVELPSFTFPDVHLDGLKSLATAMREHLPRSLAIGLVGTLGAGKTTMVQAIAESAGIDVSEVTSPTFTLLRTHQGRFLRLHHLDAYRLSDEDEFYELGVDELFDDQAWTIVEWADRVKSVMPEETLWIEMECGADPDARVIRFSTQCSEIGGALPLIDSALKR